MLGYHYSSVFRGGRSCLNEECLSFLEYLDFWIFSIIIYVFLHKLRKCIVYIVNLQLWDLWFEYYSIFSCSIKNGFFTYRVLQFSFYNDQICHHSPGIVLYLIVQVFYGSSLRRQNREIPQKGTQGEWPQLHLARSRCQLDLVPTILFNQQLAKLDIHPLLYQRCCRILSCFDIPLWINRLVLECKWRYMDFWPTETGSCWGDSHSVCFYSFLSNCLWCP